MKAGILLALLLSILPAAWIFDLSKDKLIVFASTSSYGCDFDGDKKGDLSVWNPKTNTVYFQLSSDNMFYQKKFFNDGITYKPVFADYDSDGKTDFAFHQEDAGQWIINLSSNPEAAIKMFLGNYGDIPIPLDLEGDKTFDIGIWRPANGIWVLLKKDEKLTKSASLHPQGYASDIPTTGDFDGDGKSDLVIFRPESGYWFVDKSSTEFNPGSGLGIQNGQEWDVAVPNDYDGDGKCDIAVWRPSTQTWFINYTNGAGQNQLKFGSKDDIPLSLDVSGDSIPELITWDDYRKTWNIYNMKTQQTLSYKWDVPEGSFPSSSILQTFE